MWKKTQLYCLHVYRKTGFFGLSLWFDVIFCLRHSFKTFKQRRKNGRRKWNSASVTFSSFLPFLTRVWINIHLISQYVEDFFPCVLWTLNSSVMFRTSSSVHTYDSFFIIVVVGFRLANMLHIDRGFIATSCFGPWLHLTACVCGWTWTRLF